MGVLITNNHLGTLLSNQVWPNLVDSYTFPTGLTCEEYDNLCLRARGYTGWGGSYLPLPPNIFTTTSGLALRRANEDSNFNLYEHAVLVSSVVVHLTCVFFTLDMMLGTPKWI